MYTIEVTKPSGFVFIVKCPSRLTADMQEAHFRTKGYKVRYVA